MNILEKILEEVTFLKRLFYEMQTSRDSWNFTILRKMEKIAEKHSAGIDWIPVAQQLPEENERYKGRKVIDVLVTTAKGKVTKVQRKSHNGRWRWGRIREEPKAWMPLPEEYKGE